MVIGLSPAATRFWLTTLAIIWASARLTAVASHYEKKAMLPAKEPSLHCTVTFGSPCSASVMIRTTGPLHVTAVSAALAGAATTQAATASTNANIAVARGKVMRLRFVLLH